MTTGGECNTSSEGTFSGISIIGPSVGPGRGLEVATPSEEFVISDISVMLLKAGIVMFCGITVTEEFEICWLSVLFRGGGSDTFGLDAGMMCVVFAGAGSVGIVTFGRDG